MKAAFGYPTSMTVSDLVDQFRSAGILRTLVSCVLTAGVAFDAYLWLSPEQPHARMPAIVACSGVCIPDDWLDTRGWAKYGFSFRYPSLARIHCCSQHVPEYGDVFVEDVYPKETPPGPERSLHQSTVAPHLTAMPGSNLLRADFSARHRDPLYLIGPNTYIAATDQPYLAYITCTNNHCKGQVALKELPIQYNIEYLDELHGSQIIEATNRFIESWIVAPRIEPVLDATSGPSSASPSGVARL
jgi:hypothetical protein